MSTASKLPWLLYSYPWMPYPRRLSIYLSEKQIPSDVVQIVHVSDPQAGNCVVPSQASKYPARPEGSLPILAIPVTSNTTSNPGRSDNDWLHIRQSLAIMYYLEEACASGGALSHLQNTRSLVAGSSPLERARLQGLLSLAEELTVSWNPVRMFGTKAGTMVYPEGAKEMYRWVHRTLATVNSMVAETWKNRDLMTLADDKTSVSIADIVLFQFLEFVDYCYGVDVTKGTGEEKVDVYGRLQKEEYEFLSKWYEMFKQRSSAKRDGDGEIAAPEVLEKMQHWHAGSR